MLALQAATFCWQWVLLTAQCGAAGASMQAKMKRDIISAPRLSRKLYPFRQNVLQSLVGAENDLVSSHVERLLRRFLKKKLPFQDVGAG